MWGFWAEIGPQGKNPAWDTNQPDVEELGLKVLRRGKESCDGSFIFNNVSMSLSKNWQSKQSTVTF